MSTDGFFGSKAEKTVSPSVWVCVGSARRSLGEGGSACPDLVEAWLIDLCFFRFAPARLRPLGYGVIVTQRVGHIGVLFLKGLPAGKQWGDLRFSLFFQLPQQLRDQDTHLLVLSHFSFQETRRQLRLLLYASRREDIGVGDLVLGAFEARDVDEASFGQV